MKISEEDNEKLKKLYHDAQTTPVITTGLSGVNLAESAWNNVKNFMDELGEKYDFDPTDMKGIDPETGEVKLN